MLRVLGTTRLDRHGEAHEITSRRQRRILAVLAAAGGRTVDTDVLIDATWRDALPAHPQPALQTQLSRTRRLLGDRAEALVNEDRGYRLALDRAEVDAWWFEDVTSGPDSRPVARECLRAALASWDGDPFADAADHPAVQPAAARLGVLRGRAIETLAAAELSAGDVDACLATIEPLLAEDPFRDRALAVSVRALHAAGRTPEALTRLHQHRRLLIEEFGLGLTPLLQQTERELLAEQVGSAPRAPDPLPARPISTFRGRQDELRAIGDLLEVARVVTVVGPGGAGKTRLALHAAHDLETSYPDGVWWCDLLSTAPGDTAITISTRLGLQERAGQRQLERLTDYLARRRSLLVLDNCEHLHGDVGAVVDLLVRHTDVDILATSRQPLGVDGEHRVRLGPLATDRSGTGAAPAVDLFVDRAKAVAPGLNVDGSFRARAAELCDAVGGLPLAIELAAGCVNRIDIDSLTERIGTQPHLLDQPGSTDRHHSLVGVVEASYQMLTPEERRLVDRLAAFSGPFSLRLAEAIGATDTDAAESAGATIGALVDKSLVLFRPQDGRYELLPPLQAIGQGHLSAAGQLDHVRQRHALVVLEELERIDQALHGPDEALVAPEIDRSIAELRLVRSWLGQQDDVAGLVRLAAATHWFSSLRARSELYRWADAVTDRDPDPAEHPDVDRVWACAANGAAKRGDLPRAHDLANAGGSAVWRRRSSQHREPGADPAVPGSPRRRDHPLPNGGRAAHGVRQLRPLGQRRERRRRCTRLPR